MQYRGEKAGPVDSGYRWEPTVSRGARAPPVPAKLVGALGSAGEDLRRHGMCAPTAMTGSAARPTAMGDGRTTRERATQVTRTQVSGAGSEGAWWVKGADR